MLSRIFFFIVRTIVLFAFLGWLASKFLIGDMSLAPPENASSDLNSGSGLIVPNNDPRFTDDN
ncbi:hypothetical protein PYH37_004978 [Sinorhizobium numidicum]|uniref:Uncharacterized protein n=1 Tax=Sinorhizobium numidicum TaxID=680248 RepID=A0ABY8CXJ4_9HYPH|nr:hypothetical protein [Sinorhizobium numidicum]WEX76658.1 hypothetical protein PYH37_004978 [Sinorhizobium numidicum]WEX83319.1 hypothetical protein PYH38_005690 [Sinorhizobium numidicum]